MKFIIAILTVTLFSVDAGAGGCRTVSGQHPGVGSHLLAFPDFTIGKRQRGFLVHAGNTARADVFATAYRISTGKGFLDDLRGWMHIAAR